MPRPKAYSRQQTPAGGDETCSLISEGKHKGANQKQGFRPWKGLFHKRNSQHAPQGETEEYTSSILSSKPEQAVTRKPQRRMIDPALSQSVSLEESEMNESFLSRRRRRRLDRRRNRKFLNGNARPQSAPPTNLVLDGNDEAVLILTSASTFQESNDKDTRQQPPQQPLEQCQVLGESFLSHYQLNDQGSITHQSHKSRQTSEDRPEYSPQALWEMQELCPGPEQDCADLLVPSALLLEDERPPQKQFSVHASSYDMKRNFQTNYSGNTPSTTEETIDFSHNEDDEDDNNNDDNDDEPRLVKLFPTQENDEPINEIRLAYIPRSTSTKLTVDSAMADTANTSIVAEPEDAERMESVNTPPKHNAPALTVNRQPNRNSFQEQDQEEELTPRRRKKFLKRRDTFGMEEEGTEVIFFHEDQDDWRNFPLQETSIRTEKVDQSIFLSFADMGLSGQNDKSSPQTRTVSGADAKAFAQQDAPANDKLSKANGKEKRMDSKEKKWSRRRRTVADVFFGSKRTSERSAPSATASSTRSNSRDRTLDLSTMLKNATRGRRLDQTSIMADLPPPSSNQPSRRRVQDLLPSFEEDDDDSAHMYETSAPDLSAIHPHKFPNLEMSQLASPANSSSSDDPIRDLTQSSSLNPAQPPPPPPADLLRPASLRRTAPCVGSPGQEGNNSLEAGSSQDMTWISGAGGSHDLRPLREIVFQTPPTNGATRKRLNQVESSGSPVNKDPKAAVASIRNLIFDSMTHEQSNPEVPKSANGSPLRRIYPVELHPVELPPGHVRSEEDELALHQRDDVSTMSKSLTSTLTPNTLELKAMAINPMNRQTSAGEDQLPTTKNWLRQKRRGGKDGNIANGRKRTPDDIFEGIEEISSPSLEESIGLNALGPNYPNIIGPGESSSISESVPRDTSRKRFGKGIEIDETNSREHSFDQLFGSGKKPSPIRSACEPIGNAVHRFLEPLPKPNIRNKDIAGNSGPPSLTRTISSDSSTAVADAGCNCTLLLPNFLGGKNVEAASKEAERRNTPSKTQQVIGALESAGRKTAQTLQTFWRRRNHPTN